MNNVIDICPFNCPALEQGYNFIKCKATNQYLKFSEKPFGAIRANNCSIFLTDKKILNDREK